MGSVCSSPFEVSLFQTCISLAFFGSLRIGELVSPSQSRVGGLVFEDVLLSNGALRIRIQRSKTNVFGRGVWLPIQAVNGEVCPVRAVSNYLSIHPSAPLPFCIHYDDSPVTRFQYISVFRRCLSAVGLQPNEFGSHSFRIGAATKAARAAFSEEQVQRIGRWKSSCYASYIRPELLPSY